MNPPNLKKKGVASHVSNEPIWEVSFLPRGDDPIQDGFKPSSQDPRGNFVKRWQEGDGSEVSDVLGVFVLFRDQGNKANFLSGWERVVVQAIVDSFSDKVADLV